MGVSVTVGFSVRFSVGVYMCVNMCVLVSVSVCAWVCGGGVCAWVGCACEDSVYKFGSMSVCQCVGVGDWVCRRWVSASLYMQL